MPEAEIDPLLNSEPEELCQSCGLCCCGSLHNWTNLRAREIPAMLESGLDVFELPDGSPAFRQPCASYDDPVCSIYEQRPLACRAYECKLYQSFQSKEFDLPGALQQTSRARELIAALRSYMIEVDETLPLERQVRYQWSRSSPPPAAAKLLNELVQLLNTRFGVRWAPGLRLNKPR